MDYIDADMRLYIVDTVFEDDKTIPMEDSYEESSIIKTYQLITYMYNSLRKLHID